jgi:hypothetical protein
MRIKINNFNVDNVQFEIASPCDESWNERVDWLLLDILLFNQLQFRFQMLNKMSLS